MDALWRQYALEKRSIQEDGGNCWFRSIMTLTGIDHLDMRNHIVDTLHVGRDNGDKEIKFLCDGYTIMWQYDQVNNTNHQATSFDDYCTRMRMSAAGHNNGLLADHLATVLTSKYLQKDILIWFDGTSGRQVMPARHKMYGDPKQALHVLYEKPQGATVGSFSPLIPKQNYNAQAVQELLASYDAGQHEGVVIVLE